MVVRISDKTQNYSKVTKLLVKPFGISISTLFNQTVSLFKKDEKVSDVVKGHELETKKDKSGVKGAVDSFTSNLTGKKEGAIVASEVTKKTSGNTY